MSHQSVDCTAAPGASSRQRRCLPWLTALVLCQACAEAPASGGLARPGAPVIEIESAAGVTRIGTAVRGDGSARVGAFAAPVLRVWQPVSDGPSKVVLTQPAGPAFALAPADAPLEAAFAAPEGLAVVDAAGQVSTRVAIEASETLSDIVISRYGIVAVVEQRRAASAQVRLVFSPLAAGGVAPAGAVLSFDADAGHTALAACADANRWLVAVGTRRTVETGQRVSRRTTLHTLTFSRQQWTAPVRVYDGTDGDEFSREVLMTPDSLAVRCHGRSGDVLVRSGAGWLLPSAESDTWGPPRRLLRYGEGYGVTGRTVAFCGERLVWIDNRLERGTSGLSSVLRGFPWSDAYPGWGITSVFVAKAGQVEQGTPTLLSADTGHANMVAAAERADGSCVVAWTGTRKVRKAGGTAADASAHLFVTTVAAER